MNELETLLTDEEREEMSRRAYADQHLAFAVQKQWEDPCGLRDRHVAIMIGIAKHQGLTEDEIRKTITETRRECVRREREQS